MLKLLFVKLAAGDLLELMNGVIKLAADVRNIGVVHFNGVVVGNVDHDQRNVVHTSDILVPFGHAVADVVAAQHKVRHRHLHLAEVLNGSQLTLFFGAVRHCPDLVDVLQHGVRLHGLRIFLGLAGLGVYDNIASFVLHGLAGVGVDHIVAVFVHLLCAALTSGISQADAGVAADVVVIAQILSGLAHDLAVAVCGNAGCLVFGINDLQVKRLCQFAGEFGRRPAHRLTVLLGFTGRGVNVLDHFAQGCNARAYSSCHTNILHFLV